MASPEKNIRTITASSLKGIIDLIPQQNYPLPVAGVKRKREPFSLSSRRYLPERLSEFAKGTIVSMKQHIAEVRDAIEDLEPDYSELIESFSQDGT